MRSFSEIRRFLKGRETLIEWRGKWIRLSYIDDNGDVNWIAVELKESATFHDIALGIGHEFFQLHAPNFLIPEYETPNKPECHDPKAPRETL